MQVIKKSTEKISIFNACTLKYSITHINHLFRFAFDINRNCQSIKRASFMFQRTFKMFYVNKPRAIWKKENAEACEALKVHLHKSVRVTIIIICCTKCEWE